MPSGSRRPGDSERSSWQNPHTILAEAGLKAGDTYIEPGCGEGFFTLPAARITGPRGKVYGLDINGQSLALLRGKAAAEGLNNLILEQGKAEEIVLCQHCADIVFLGIVLHDFDDPVRVLKNAAKMLKPDGKLVNLDWKKEPMPWGPPVEIRFDPEQAVKLINQAGFAVDGVNQSGIYHYIVTAGLIK